jgi:hypothetical protein
VVLLALVCALAPVNPLVVERWFSTGLYPSIQHVLTPVSNVVPFAVFDVMLVAAVTAVIVSVVRAVRAGWRARRWSPIVAAGARLVTGAAAVYLLFLMIWGWNYRRLPMMERLEMNDAGTTADQALALGALAVVHLNGLHAAAHAAGWPPDARDGDALRRAFEDVQQRLSRAPAAEPGRLKQTLLGPYFRWTSVDGMVNPFALEILANPDLLPFERPFIAAHEWSHLAGYAHEADANFVGWLACVRADPASQYSGWLYLYWQVASELDADRATLAARLAEGPRADLNAIASRIRRGQLPWLRTVSTTAYDHYLRANRVEEGIRAYGEVVTLILRARFDPGWTPVRRGEAPAHSR